MNDAFRPRDANDVQAAVQLALAQRKTLEVVGRGSKRALGRAAQWDMELDLSGIAGVTLYEPEELVLSARAGTLLNEVEDLLAADGQELAFEPMDYGPLLGGRQSRGTIGGAIAANLSGPRRIKAGAARDHFLGFSAVSGRAETFKSGGRVVKNVTGYDLCKVLAGSHGTLAAMTDVTVKVLPRAESEQSVIVLGLDDIAAARAMTAAVGSAADVSGAAHLSAAAASRVVAAAAQGRAITALRLEGVAPSVAHRRHALEALLKPFGPLAALGEAASRALWKSVRDVTPFAADGPSGDRIVWRISTAPTHGAAVGTVIASRTDAEVLYDWAGGLVWVALIPSDDGGALLVRRAVAAAGGHATLIRAPAAVRATVPVFAPPDGALGALTRRLKESFDPQGVLNPGRMWPGV